MLDSTLVAAGNPLWYSDSGFLAYAQKKETLQVYILGAVPDDGEQARPSGSEKPKVVIMATHLKIHGFLYLLTPRNLF